MDKKLQNNDSIIEGLKLNLKSIYDSNKNISFEIWTTIPEHFLDSYYQNESLINPISNIETFEQWKGKLPNRPNPLFSVAIKDNQVVSSVCGFKRHEYEISMNLWATNEAFRKKGIGKAVLFNFIIYSLEQNKENIIRALDITNSNIDSILSNIGFQ